MPLSLAERKAQLNKVIDDALNELAALDVKTNAGSLPNSGGAGSSVDHGEYAKRLQERITWAEERISSLGGPFEVTSEAR
jgi:hypothetical protein